MKSRYLREAIHGIFLALLVYSISSSAVSLLLAPAFGQAPPLFSATVIAPTGGNVVRRQYASIITSNLIALGVDAKLFYVNFDVLVNRMFFINSPQGATFDKGGYDIGFIGWGYISPVPDFRSNFDGRAAYLAPNGNNYALYNNPELNSLFDQLYRSTDTQKQVDLTRKFQEIIFRDAPYNYIFETISTVPRDQKWTAWGRKDLYNVITFPDVQHWAGGTELTFAEANPVFPGQNLNIAVTTSANSFYALYIYRPLAFSGAGLQEVNGRDLSYIPALATSITASADGLDWTIQIRKGALFHSGVEITADDFVWTRWALFNPKTASVGLGDDIQYLGNVVDFTFMNGTKVAVDNREKPTDAISRGSWKVVDRYTFQFHLPEIYAFTRQTYAAFAPLPKHILEKFPSQTWDSIPFSTASNPVTYTWNAALYGGKGSYTAVGPVGAGPYYLESFDFTRHLATLKKFKQFWNATGLEALGQFTVETYKVVWISSKDAALAALKNGEVNVLDNNYQLARDKATLQQMGVNIIQAPELGWQEQGFNLMHPVFGTGVDTPLGKSDPSKAAEAARHVRKALSFLIPREQIVSELLAGAGFPLATNLGPGWGTWYNSNLKPDPFDINAAANELKAAGYTVSVGPQPARIAVAGNPLLGTVKTVTISGFAGVARMMIVIQESRDAKAWRSIAAAVSDNRSRYEVSVPAPEAFGTIYYRANLTGYVLPEKLAQMPITPELVNKYINEKQFFGGRPLLPQSVTDPITVSSATNDALVVVAVIAIIVVASALVWRSRRKKTTSPTPSPTKSA